ncbi:ABC transporter substrate-binding protein [Cupriavidus gilardii CR3]|uniref:Tripartite tricarboxylate transporter substrate binding protein n=1 Tax=Cupriavidus gilardii TaxID=82541 RepID=A0A849B5G3_9BURK|nr:ABC transporter substrate-binding protein [Cupriavidus gilardii CR3]KAB0595930.1 tripartite tricarboxylate transporter substrate binding protein [Cupriavidus gilardii]NNH10442.1 tripartite tricarboxylate transporter substrate binding protein [Cupriavidus gilardii]
MIGTTTRIARLAAAMASALIGLAWAVSVAAADFPEKPITFVVPFGAGSATDLLARALSASMAQQTGKAVVVENRPGASGMIAAQHVARAAADGYTVLITTNTTQAANPHLFKKLHYDPITDFLPLTALGRGGQVLVVRADSPFRTVDDLVQAARKAKGKLSFGSGNSSSRIAGEMLKQLTGTDIVWVGYNSNPNALNDLLGGHIDMMVIDTVTGLSQIKSGKLRALGASTRERLPELPDVPTLDEAGIRGYDMGYWFAAYVPAGTPAPAAARLRQLLIAAVDSPGARAFFRNSATQAWTTTPSELRAFQNAEIQKWGRVVKGAGIEPE